MCGITGIISLSENSKFKLSKIEAAVDTLRQRGPDSQGVFKDGDVALGHARLSIIDTSNKASQPFTDQSGRYTIVFNGEIYNFKKLRTILEARGCVFTSQSDTEVLLHLYINQGTRCLNELNGFFAFAIYDKEEQTVFIARDRMGIKPLLYYADEEQFVFGSELKALLKFDIPKEIDTKSLFTYLQLNYIPAPYSILEGVRKLMPGNYICLNLKKKPLEVKEQVYYEIPNKNENLLTVNASSYTESKSKLKVLLEEAIKKRLVSDVPLGTFLSGGIDSSIIATVASRHVKDLQSFSIGYKDEPYFDETKYAKLVAKKNQTKHTVFSLTNQDLFENFHNVLDYLDEPFADSSAIPVYILSKLTKKEVTVALSGDGADEMFSGYNKHKAELKAREPGVQGRAIKLLSPLFKKLPQSRSSKLGNLNRQLNRFAEGMKLSHKERYWKWASFLNEEDANYFLKVEKRINTQRLTDEAYSYKKRKEFFLRNIKKEGSFNDTLYTDMELVLQNDMLRKVDAMSMANSLEVRTPFLDHKLVDFAFSLPSIYKINGSTSKKILKDAYREELPEELYNRPKHGFEVPLLKWFQTDLKSKITDDYLKDDFIEEQGIFNVEAIKELKQQLFSKNPKDAHATIWALIAFQHWWKKYLA